jgi:tRNA pseudouridine55 synthase
MDGLLIVDKPSGPTSHDIVARVRRILGERRVGHTGTLDPLASGVLPLVIGRATRLARFISGDKTYLASIRLGVSTETYDAMGDPVGDPFSGAWPSLAAVDRVLEPFRGTFEQQPPAYSAKKVGGQRSYARARRAASAADVEEERPLLPAPVRVTAYGLDALALTGDLLTLRVRCSAGFYVRSLAHDLGVALGTGAHLTELRRTAAGGISLDRAVTLADLETEAGRARALDAMVPMERMLDALPAVALNETGLRHVRFGRDLGPGDTSRGFVEAVGAANGPGRQHVRLLDPSGQLVAMAEAAEVPGLLHPAVVLM